MSGESYVRSLITKVNRRRLRYLSKLKGPKYRHVVDLFGYKVGLSLDEQIQMEIALRNFEVEETGWVRQYLKPGMTFVDVGANMGYFSLLAADRVGPGGKVISFEPSPYCQSRLKEAIDVNSIKQIALEGCGLGEKPGSLDLVVEHLTLHSPSFLAKSGDCRYSVPVTTLDIYMERTKLEFIDMMKIDVEGFEPNVLEGARGTLGDGRCGSILIELNEIWLGRNSWSAENLDRHIRTYGFTECKSVDYGFYKNVLYMNPGAQRRAASS